MKDLAKLAGVNKSTVSRALAGSSLVNQETRDKVLGLAKEHNYRMNFKARNFFLKESLSIAILIPSVERGDWKIYDPFFMDLLGHIATSLGDRGHELILAKPAAESFDWIEGYLKSKRSDGVILYGQGIHEEKLGFLAEKYGPLIVWGAHSPSQEYVTVGSNNFIGGTIATEHLLKLGRKNIAFLGDIFPPTDAERYRGYSTAMDQAGYKPILACPEDKRFTADNVGTIVHDLLASEQTVDAIFAASDVIALDAIRAIQEYGLKVPQDIAIVGYDDISLAHYSNPLLTTVSQDTTLAAEALVECLLQLIEGKEVDSVFLPTKLVVRKSCGAQE